VEFYRYDDRSFLVTFIQSASKTYCWKKLDNNRIRSKITVSVLHENVCGSRCHPRSVVAYSAEVEHRC